MAGIEIMCRDDREVKWNCYEMNGGQSVLGFLQRFRDKSQSMLTGVAFKFYPLHVCFLNSIEGTRQILFQKKNVCLSSCAIRFIISSDANERSGKLYIRVDALQAVFMSFNHAMMSRKQFEVSGILLKIEDGVCLQFHLVITSFVVEKMDAKNLLFVKCGTQNKITFPQMIRYLRQHSLLNWSW